MSVTLAPVSSTVLPVSQAASTRRAPRAVGLTFAAVAAAGLWWGLIATVQILL